MAGKLFDSKTPKGRNNRAMAVLGVLIVACAGAFAFVYHEDQKRGGYDQQTLCPLDEQRAGTTVIIMDATDSISDAHKNKIERAYGELQKNLELYERVVFFTLRGGDYVAPDPIIELCNPGNRANPLYQNPGRIQRTFERKFHEPIGREIQASYHQEPQSQSPILEMIKGVSRHRVFIRAKGKKRRLIIISDMLQNTPAYSHYGSGMDFASWSATPEARPFADLDIADAEVEIWQLARADSRFEHQDFWNSYFRSLGVSSIMWN